MTTFDRTIAPGIKPIDMVNFVDPQKAVLYNGIPVYQINAGSQPVVRIDFIFDAGIWYQHQPLIASTTSSMLIEGTEKYTAYQIAEKLDYHGAFISQTCTNDHVRLTLYTLNRFLDQTLDILVQIIKQSIFPEKELKTNLNKRKQAFLVDQEKTRELAKNKMNEVLFGAGHPYSNIVQAEDYDQVQQSSIMEYYNYFYTPENCKIILTGKIEDDLLDKTEKLFGQNDWNKNSIQKVQDFKVTSADEKRFYIQKSGAVQSTINIGCVMFNRLNPDFQEMNILSVLFGGYFGSRLMKNIREEKGFTYGIYSRLQSYLHGGMFVIGTEVKADVVEAALKEIYIEIEKLQQQAVPEDELEKVKNYILGDLLGRFDGLFALSDTFNLLVNYGLDFNYFREYIEKVKSITPERLMQLANQYLNKEDLIEVVAGP